MEKLKQVVMEQWRLLLLLLGISIGLSVAGGYLMASNQPPTPTSTSFTWASTASTSTISSTQVSTTVMVDIKGEVKRPGVYELPVDARVKDLLVKASGFTADANQNVINLAMKLVDQQMLYVPHKDEATLPVSGENQGTQTSAATALVNINTADLTELQTLSGIGEAKAAAIISYREENGLFTSIEELTEVSGIGDKTLETLQEAITVN
ncbi:MAG: helix-hairpin-helix domain-containing protein [Enterococcus sp.]